MAARLEAAGVDDQLDVLPGARHALDFRDDAWAPTVAFLEKHLAAAPDADDGSFPAGPLLAAALVVLAGAGAVAALRRRARP